VQHRRQQPALLVLRRPTDRRGFVAIAVDERDQRTRRIVLAAKGTTKCNEASKLCRQAQERFESALGQQTAAKLREILSGVAALDLR
jgi:DNA-binding MarR family transcriptional regulator